MNTRTILLLFSLLSLTGARLQAQPRHGQALLDSLLAVVPNAKPDTNKVVLMSRITGSYKDIDPAEGVRWGQQAVKLAQQLHWQKGEASAYNDLANCYISQGAYPTALETYFKALRIYEAIDDKSGINDITLNIGSVYQRKGELDKALEWHNKALRMAEERKDDEAIQFALTNIAGCYEREGRFDEALANYRRALQIVEAQGDQESIAYMNGNIGTTYLRMAQYATALPYLFKALRMAEQMGEKRTAAVQLGNIGETYYILATDSIVPNPDSLVGASRAVNLNRAVDYLEKALVLCREIGLIEAIPEFAGGLSDARLALGDATGALAAYKESTAAKDSLFNKENSAQIADLETKRAVELKEKDILIARIKKRNERILFIAGFAVLLLILGILFRNFRRQQQSNRLLAREKKRSDDLLLNILPAEVAEELKESGSANARQFDDVTVLFTDFVNFTGLAEQLSPQALVNELHECFTAFDAIMGRNGLEKIKTIGDAYLAVCGLPVQDPRHAQKTVQAAIDILHFMAERGRQRTTFGIRIGINSGQVVAGIVGVKKFAYDIWGDTVNTAARMEQHGEAGKINISESTCALVKDDYPCTYRGEVAAKNKGAMAMYFVEAPATIPA